MKTLILAAFAAVTASVVAQDSIPQISIRHDALSYTIVVPIEGISAEQAYNSALNWVQVSYKNPDEVLKTNIPNKKIRVNGFKKDAYYEQGISKVYYDLNYTTVLSFKDGRYRLEFILNKTGKYAPWVILGKYFKKNGDVRGYGAEDNIAQINEAINSISQSIYNYISGKTEAADDDW